MQEYSAQKICDKIFEYAQLKDKEILEIGCGSGRISSILSAQANLLTAIDPDEKAILQAAEDFPEIDFRIGSGESLNFEDNSFDIVIFTLSLHHQNSESALIEASRILKNGGQILVIEPVAEGEIEQIFSFLVNEDKEKAIAQKSIKNSGLSLLKEEYFSADWVFDNEADLINSVFGYYDMPIKSNTVEKIKDFMGMKIKSCPLVCEDKMVIQSLYK